MEAGLTRRIQLLTRKTTVVALLTLCAPLLDRGAWAQDKSTTEARADEFFRQGVEYMKAERFIEGCPLIGASNQLVPKPGKLFTQAECERNAGRIATASSLYQEYLGLFAKMTGTQHKDHEVRAKLAQGHCEALAIDIPLLTVKVSRELPAGGRVFRDDVELEPSLIGVGLSVDPGDHVVRLELPNGAKVEERARLDVRAKVEMVLRVEPAAEPAPTPAKTAQPAVVNERHSGGSLRTPAFVAGGLGLAGVVVGAVTGGMAMARVENIKSNCNGDTCNAGGKAAADEAQRLGLVSTIGFGVGVAGVATGLVLFVVGREKEKSATLEPRTRVGVLDAGPAGAIVGLKGGF